MAHGHRARGDHRLTGAAAAGHTRRLRVAVFGHAQGRRGDGLSTYSSELVRALASHGVEVRFFAHRADGDVVPVAAADARLMDAWRHRTVTVPRPGAARMIRAELGAFRPHVVHVSWSFSLQDGLIARAAHDVGAVCVATFHLPHGPAGTARGRMLQALYRYHCTQMGQVDRCIVLSAEQGRLLAAAGYPRDRIAIVANGVDTDLFSPGPSPWRDRLGAAVVTLYMGRLDPEKRVPELVDTFLSLHPSPGQLLCIAGDGAQRDRVRRMAAGRDNVRLLGLVAGERRLEIMRGSDVFVLPSTTEGLALSLLEAMACGLAVVATDAGDDGRALGDAGVVIPTHPLRPALDHAMGTLIADASLRQRLGNAARARAVDTFAMQRTITDVIAVYADAAGRSPGVVSIEAPAALP